MEFLLTDRMFKDIRNRQRVEEILDWIWLIKASGDRCFFHATKGDMYEIRCSVCSDETGMQDLASDMGRILDLGRKAGDDPDALQAGRVRHRRTRACFDGRRKLV